MVVHTYNLSTWESETDSNVKAILSSQQIPGQPQILSETLSPRKKRNKRIRKRGKERRKKKEGRKGKRRGRGKVV